jgi:hypothetical protein
MMRVDLTPVQSSELAVGKPLLWDLFNQDGQQLLGRGYVINTPDELQVLEKTPVFRTPQAPPAPPAANAQPDTGAAMHRYRFEDIRLSVGDQFQLSSPARAGANRCMVKLIGYVKDKALIVDAPLPGQWRPPLIEGDQIAIHVFSGQTAFGFNVYVDKVIKLPFEYLHLSFPKQIVGKIIRKSRRIKTEIVAAIADNPAPATICNLSVNGAEVRANIKPGQLGSPITLSFVLKIHGMDIPLALLAVIRSLKHDAHGVRGALRCGVEFLNLERNDVSALQSLIYQELVEHPHNVA